MIFFLFLTIFSNQYISAQIPCYYDQHVIGHETCPIPDKFPDFQYQGFHTSDINGDGIQDLLLADFGSGKVYLMILNDSGCYDDMVVYESGVDNMPTFLYSSSFGFYSMPAKIESIGDIDGNGVNDLGIAYAPSSSFGDYIYIILLDTDYSILSSQEYTTNYLSTTNSGTNGWTNYLFPIGDVNGDGIPDIAVNNGFDIPTSFTIVYLNSDGSHNGEHTINNAYLNNLVTPARSVTYANIENIKPAGDLDGDGGTELIATWNDPGAAVLIYLNPDGTYKSHIDIMANTSFTPLAQPSSGTITNTILPIDIDGNGTCEIIANDVTYFFNSDYTAQEYSCANSSSYVPYHLALGDIGNDGSIDVFQGTDENNIYPEAAPFGIIPFNLNSVFLYNYTVPTGYPSTCDSLVFNKACPASIVNTIAAQTPAACYDAKIDTIDGVAFDLVGDGTVPYYDGIESTVFQWQTSTDGTNWVDVAGATTSSLNSPGDYTGDVYFRRCMVYDCCNMESCSNEIMITQQGTDTIPEITINPVFYCPASPTLQTIVTDITGSGPYTYSWLPTTGLSDPTIENPDITPGAVDLYELTVSDANGCVGTGTLVVLPLQAFAGSESGNIYFCEGDTSIQIGEVIPGATVTYAWSPTTDLDCSDCATPIASPTAVTTYTLTVDDGNGCVTTDEITVYPSSHSVDAGPDVYVCQGTDVPIGMTAEPGAVYGWSSGFYIDSQTTSDPTFFSGVVPDPNPYTYILTVFDSANVSCPVYDTLLAHVAWAEAGPEDTICMANTPRQIGGPDCCNGQATHTWTIINGEPNTFYDPVTGTFSNTSNEVQPIIFPPSCKWSHYQLEVTWGPNADNSGGASCIDDVIYHNCECGGGCPITDAEFENDLNCGIGLLGTKIKLDNGGAFLYSGYYEMVWTSDVGNVNTLLSCTDCPNPSLLVDVTQDILFTLTYALRGTTDSCFFEVPVYDSAKSAPTGTATGGSVCLGSSIAIGGGAVAGWNYEWSPTGGLDDPNIANPTATITGTMNYSLLLTDLSTGCEFDTTVTVAAFEFPGIAGGPYTVCNGDGAIIGSAPKTGITTYSWSPTTGLDNPNVAQPTASPSTTTTYTLTVGDGTCSYSEDATVTVVNSLSPTAANKNMCIGGNTTLGILVADMDLTGATYNWSPSTGLSSTTVASPTVSGITTNQTYSVTVTTASGLCSGSTTLDVTVNPLPTLAALSDIEYCNTPVQIGPAGDASLTYLWSPSMSLDDHTIMNPTASPTQATTYDVTMTDVNGCSVSGTQNVTLGFPELALNSANVCEGSEVQLNAIAAVPGATYSWSPATNLNNPTAAQPIWTAVPGTFDIEVIATLGSCSIKDTVTVTSEDVFPNEELPPTIISCAEVCQNIIFPTIDGMAYEWAYDGIVVGTSSSYVLCPEENGTLSLKLTSADGCEKKMDMQVLTTTEGNCPVARVGVDCPEIQCLPVIVTIKRGSIN